MSKVYYLADDLVRLRLKGKSKRSAPFETFFWGDPVKVTGEADDEYLVDVVRAEWNETAKEGRGTYEGRTYSCTIPKSAHLQDKPLPLLKVKVIDVGQGDGAILETPSGKTIIVDGGEEENFAQYVHVAYYGERGRDPLPCEAIIVTHGDADHFSGLTKTIGRKRHGGGPVITANRVFHNGLVRGKSKRDTQAFGSTIRKDGHTYAVDLENDLLRVPDNRMNPAFQKWKAALETLKSHNPNLTIERIQSGNNEKFDFLRDDRIQVEVLGPIVEEVDGKTALRFLRGPDGGLSASHTINGHSVVLKLTYNRIHILLGGDLNEESEENLVEDANGRGISLMAEVLKVPHHGSADFSPKMLAAVQPVVSIVSSGDENVAKEYIHPRAGLVGALGKYSRAEVERPLVYVTEMVAFFERLGTLKARQEKKKGGKVAKEKIIRRAYWKKEFGIVHVRTDGERVLVVTHSGRDDRKESYVFVVDSNGKIKFDPKPRIV